VRKKIEYVLDDVTRNDAMMIHEAAGAGDKAWYCFGRAWYKLDALELIDEDLRPTPLGIAVARKVLEVQ
jgi:hypothetical protein